MNAMVDTTNPGRGVSVRVLLAAVAAAVVLTATVAWLFLRQPAESADGEDHENDLPAGVVELTPEVQKNAALGLVQVVSRRLPTTIDVTGNVAADDARVAHIRPLARGPVERVWVRLGERVKKDQPLATYDNI